MFRFRDTNIDRKFRENLRQVMGMLAENIMQIVGMLASATFLCLWAGLQWWTDGFLKRIEIDFSNMGKMVLVAFQVLFAISTLVPVVIFLYRDIRVIYIRATREIQSEISNLDCDND